MTPWWIIGMSTVSIGVSMAVVIALVATPARPRVYRMECDVNSFSTDKTHMVCTATRIKSK